MSTSISGTIFGFGLAFLAAAIVGGGLSLLGVTIPILKSVPRQILLGGVGAILIRSSDQWPHINEAIADAIFPRQFVTETFGPATLEPGVTRSFPVRMSRHGRVDVVLQTVVPDFNGFTGAKGLPGQDGLYITVCGRPTECEHKQMGASDSLSRELTAGTATISTFNFATSPRMTFTFRVTHPR